MARTCQICGRGALAGHSRSHSNIATKRTQKINLQTALYKGERVKACARCVKTVTRKNKA